MDKNWIKKLDEIIIKGKLKMGVFRKKKEFSIQVYVTPKKRIIMGIDIKGVSIKKLKLPFSVGDRSSDVKSWTDIKKFDVKYIERVF